MGEQRLQKEYFFSLISSETVGENYLKYDLDNQYSLVNTVDGTRSRQRYTNLPLQH